MDPLMNALRKLELLGTLLEKGDGADKDLIPRFLNDIYDGIIGKYRPVIQALPALSEKAGEDLGSVIASLVNVVNSGHKTKELKAALDEYAQLKADRKAKALKAYQKAGFRRAEAMTLIISDDVVAKQALSSLKNIKSS